MYYVGLDVSLKRIAVCIVDSSGKVAREVSVTSTPDAVSRELKRFAQPVERIGLEAGPSSAWLARGLRAAGLPAIVIDATHAAASLKTGFRNKTDKNDARGIADIMRVEKFRAVYVKSPEAQRIRTLLVAREQLRRQSLDAKNTIWSILQAEGMMPPGLSSAAFDAAVAAAMDEPELASALAPLVSAIAYLDKLLVEVDRKIAMRAKHDPICRKLMTVPGVGPLVALTYLAGVDDPSRFGRGRVVGAHFGLTPRRYQSGNLDWSGRISRAGDASVRRALYQAANVLIHHSRGWCALKSWAVRVAKRRGLGKAKVALARKLAIVLLRIWITGEPYRVRAA